MSFFDKLRTEKLLSFTLVVLTLCVGIVIGTVVTSNWGVNAARGGQAAPGASQLVIPNPVELSTAFSQLAKQVGPSVVNIRVDYTPKVPTRTRNGRPPASPNPNEDQGDSGGMQDFFRYFGFGQGGMPDMTPSSAEGSGVVVDKGGYILTNNHVVDKATKIRVKFDGDPMQYDAKVVGTDEQTDLAVIRVEDKKGIVPAKIGNSDAVQVGDWAVAIGSPFGFQATVTAGIISAKEREIDGETTQYQRFLQTDAAINPGNSGGPLLNIRGEVIGINTAIATNSRGYQGVGFALPINTAADVYNQIIKNGKVTRGSIGVRITQSGTEKERANLAVAHVAEGAYVELLAPGGPAEKAGVEPGDVLVSVNGKPVHSGNDLISSVIAIPVGNTVSLGVVHEGKRKDVKAQIGDIAQVWPEDYGGAPQQSSAAPEGGPASRLGFNVQALNDQRRQTLGITQTGGVQITEVLPGSFADDIGLQANDILLSIRSSGANQPVNSPADVLSIQATLKPGDPVQFRVLRRVGRNGPWTSTLESGILPASSR